MDHESKQALHSWITLNNVLNQLSEDQVKSMLEYELQHENRKTFLERLHQRYNTLRVMRERKEMLG